MTVYRSHATNLRTRQGGRFDSLDIPGEWVESALCAGVDPVTFYPTDDEDNDGHGSGVRKAKRICAACPVTAPCLAYALAHETVGRGSAGYGYGVAGGKTATERRRILVAREREAS